MLRARIIVDRAFQWGLIRAHRPLLIVGTGASGVTAALRSIEIGIPTTLVSEDIAPFGPQRHCQTRVICPTQYDWPLDHFEAKTFPWAGPRMQLPWNRGKASAIALDWRENFEKQIEGLGEDVISYRKNLRLDPDVIEKHSGGFPEIAGEMLEVAFDHVAQREIFGMLISCTGPGSERVEIDSFRSWKFWEDDKLQLTGYGIGGAAVGKPSSYRTLISGGGDGALQDFIRAATKQDTVDSVLELVLRCLKDSFQYDYISRIFSIEDQYQRAFSWNDGSTDDCRINIETERLYAHLIDELRGSNAWTCISDNLRATVSADAYNLFIAHNHYHFSKCYALNRFVVMVLIKFLEDEKKSSIRLRNREVNSITGVDHTCDRKPAECVGRAHSVSFSTVRCGGLAPGDVAVDPTPFQVIVLRHGVLRNHPFVSRKELGYGRHLLPYRLV